MIKSTDLGRLSRLTLDLFFPLLTFSTITRNFDPSNLSELWLMPVLGIAIMLVGAVIGHYLKRFLRDKTPARLGTFHHICAINNYVFLPIIILQNVWGERHVALLLLMNVGSTIGFWTIGVMTFTGGGTLGKALRSIFSINVAAVVAALLVCFLGIPIPEPLAYSIRYLGDITVPFMLVVIGVALVILFQYSACAGLTAAGDLRALVLIPAVSRCCSVLAIQLLPPMQTSQYAHRQVHWVVPVLMLMAAISFGFWLSAVTGLALLAVIAGFCLALLRAYRSLQGMNGDISGYCITLGELAGLCALAILCR